MSEVMIKNLEHEKVILLSEEVAALPGQIVSKTLAQNTALSVTLFSFAKGEEIATHESDGDAMVYVLEGEGYFTVGDRSYLVRAGETLVMPAKKPHSVSAKQNFKMFLLVVFPDKIKK